MNNNLIQLFICVTLLVQSLRAWSNTDDNGDNSSDKENSLTKLIREINTRNFLKQPEIQALLKRRSNTKLTDIISDHQPPNQSIPLNELIDEIQRIKQNLNKTLHHLIDIQTKLYATKHTVENPPQVFDAGPNEIIVHPPAMENETASVIKIEITNPNITADHHESHHGLNGTTKDDSHTGSDVLNQQFCECCGQPLKVPNVNVNKYTDDIYESLNLDQIFPINDVGPEDKSVAAQWSDWSNWSDCTAKYGNGKQYRFRKCSNSQCAAKFEVDEQKCSKLTTYT